MKNQAHLNLIIQTSRSFVKSAFCRRHCSFTIVAVSLLLLVARGQAQNFSIDWFSVDGGGGQSSGGTFSLAGTIGQPDAGSSTGGTFTLQGGFWAAEAINLPVLKIRLIGGQIIVSWPATFIGFALEQSNSLSPQATWTAVNSAVVAVNGENTLTVPVAAGARFYRLKK